jgi:chromate reductase
LLRIALEAAGAEGAVTTTGSIGDLPVYNPDLEGPSLTEPVRRWRRQVQDADLVVIASPEYNYSLPGGLKNAIDWASKPNLFDRKTAAIMGASPGPFGTLRMQPHLRQILAALNVYLVPQPQVMVRNAAEAFDGDGRFKDAKVHEQVRTLVRVSMKLSRAMAA